MSFIISFSDVIPSVKISYINFESHFATIDTINSNNNYDLIISNYAFSELPKNMQLDAINKIINKSKRGYMLVNNFHKISFRYLSQNGYSKNIKNLKVHEEIPNSYLFNKLLTFVYCLEDSNFVK